MKLVRDRIPTIIRDQGGDPIIRTAGEDELDGLLDAKLSEEVGEWLESHSLDELVDILQVVYALADRANVSRVQLEQLRQRKVERRGAFINRIVWEGNR